MYRTSFLECAATFYPASILTHVLAFYIRHSISGILCDMRFDSLPCSLSGIYSDIPSGVLPDIHSEIRVGSLPGNHSGIRPGACTRSGFLFGLLYPASFSGILPFYLASIQLRSQLPEPARSTIANCTCVINVCREFAHGQP